MSDDLLHREQLEEALIALAADAEPREDCPPAERLWEVTRGEGSTEERRQVIDHMATCPACSEAWRLARELSEETAEEPAASSPSSGWSWRPLALAATLVLALAAGFLLRDSFAPAPIERGGGDEIAALAGDGEQDREALRLAWTAGPEGTIYAVTLTTSRLEVLLEAEGLGESELVVEPETLESIPAGGQVLWQVEALYPDGSRRASPTFIARLD